MATDDELPDLHNLRVDSQEIINEWTQWLDSIGDPPSADEIADMSAKWTAYPMVMHHIHESVRHTVEWIFIWNRLVKRLYVELERHDLSLTAVRASIEACVDLSARSGHADMPWGVPYVRDESVAQIIFDAETTLEKLVARARLGQAKATEPDTADWWTVTRAAEEAGTDKGCVSRWANEDRFLAHGEGSKRRIEPNSFKDFIRERDHQKRKRHSF